MNNDYKTVLEKGEEKNLTSSDSSEKYNTEVVKEREEAKRRILKEYPNMPKDTLEFVLSLPVEKKIPKVTELGIVHATAEQQEEMERHIKKVFSNH